MARETKEENLSRNTQSDLLVSQHVPTPTWGPWVALPEIKGLPPDPCEEEEEKPLCLLSQATPACEVDKAQEAQNMLSISYPGVGMGARPVTHPLPSHMVL